MYYQDADGAVVVYDLGDVETFDDAGRWIKELNAFLEKPIPMIIAGNKEDLPNRAIDQDKAEMLASSHNAKLFYTSAKTGSNTNEMFEYLAEEIAKSSPKPKLKGSNVMITKHQKKSKDKGCC